MNYKLKLHLLMLFDGCLWLRRLQACIPLLKDTPEVMLRPHSCLVLILDTVSETLLDFHVPAEGL